MKFENRLNADSIFRFKDLYLDYHLLKDFVNDPNMSYELFTELVLVEFKKINAFVNSMIKADYKMMSQQDLFEFVKLNYIGFFKIYKKYDKRKCQNKLFDFYQKIQHQDFYCFYKSNRLIMKTQNDIKLVIFDKDGTLIDNTLMFGKWTIQLLTKLSRIYPSLLERIPNQTTVWEHLGYNYIDNTFTQNSVIAKGTNDDIRNAICDYIVNIKKIVRCKTNTDRIVVVERLRKLWFDIEVTEKTIRQCGNIRALFEYLKMKNIKIAVCTSDDRKPTEDAFRILNLGVKPSPLTMSVFENTYNIIADETENENISMNIEQVNKGSEQDIINNIDRREMFMIDYLVCGNDMIPSKPSPEPLLKICKRLDVKPENAMMVGDTIADIHAGINAKFGKVVGVLSGGYTDSNLNEADHVIDNINSLVKVFLNLDCNEKIVSDGS